MDVVVVGGGPAGMMTAARAAELGSKVVLLEKNASLGKKLLLTGGGRCNFTNAEPDNHKLASFYGKKGRFLLSVFSRFSSSDALDFFRTRGMAYKIEDRNRAFPASDDAGSVLKVLRNYMEETGVRVQTHVEATKLIPDRGRLAEIQSTRGVFAADRFILATGGTSLPATGSTGDGYRWLKALGHDVRVPEPSLVPVAVSEPWVKDLSGLAFSEVRLEARVGNTRALASTGKLLFTHFGLSGPLVLNMSTALATAHREAARSGSPLSLRIDFFPGSDEGEIDRTLLASFQQGPNRLLKTALASFVPPRLAIRLLALSELDPDAPLHRFSKVDRRKLGSLLKTFPLTFHGLMDSSRAVVSSGGLSLEEVDFRTMTSRLVPNLGVVGDLLDFDRPTGGFSLQICWATAWIAGSGRETF